MRNNRNISPRQDGTLKSVVILNFRRTQSVDNQCLFFCQNVTSFTGKEKDSETGFYYFGARYYDPPLSSLFISVDPMADKYPSLSPYAYCAWNPVKLVDPDGEEWKDKDGNIIVDHSKIKVYIFYDPKDFKEQSLQMYNEAIEKYGPGSAALSDVTTEKEFAQDWHDMAGNDIREVNLNYHGTNQAIHLDYRTEEYITSTGDGKTNKTGRRGLDIKQLPSIKGNIKNAQLNINSCRSNKRDEYLRGTMQTIMEAFHSNFGFRWVRGTSHGVTYDWLTGHPRPGHNGMNFHLTWEFMPNVKVNTNFTEYLGTKR